MTFRSARRTNLQHGGASTRIRRLVLAPVAVLVTLLTAVLPVSAANAAGPAVVTVDLTITDAAGNPITTMDPATMNGYYVRYTYTCSVATCTDTKVEIPATPLDPYYNTYRLEGAISFTPPFAGATATGTAATGITVDLGDLEPSVGIFTIYYATSGRPLNTFNGASFFPPNYQIPQMATISSANANDPDSGSASVRWGIRIYDPGLGLSVTPATSTRTGLEVQVTPSSPSGCILYMWQNNGHRGIDDYLCAASWTSVVKIPDNAEYVAGSGGMYDPVARTVSFSASGNTLQAGRGNYYGSPFRVVFPAENYPTSGADCKATETFTATHTTVYLDGTVKTPAPTNTGLVVDNCVAFAAAEFVGKTVTRSKGTAADPVISIPTDGAADYLGYWDVRVNNTANVEGVATITDADLEHDGMPVYRVRVITGAPGVINVELSGGGTDSSATGTYNAPAGQHIVAATVTSAPLNGPNATPEGTLSTQFRVVFDFRVSSTAEPGERTNTATATMEYPNYPDLDPVTFAPSSSTVTLEPTVVVPPSQLPVVYFATAGNPIVDDGGSPGNIAVAGSPVAWTLRAGYNNAPNSNSIVPQYVFIAPNQWDILGHEFTGSQPPEGTTIVQREVTIGGATRQALVVTWPGPIAIGASGAAPTLPLLTVNTTPRPTAPAGTGNVANIYVGEAAHGDATYGTVTYVDAADIDGDGVTTDRFAAATRAAEVGPTRNATMKKEICQPDPDAGDGCFWIADPSVKVGVPPTATSIRYRVTVTNTGNTELTNVVIHDVLPFDEDSRGSTVSQVVATTDSDTDVDLSFSASSDTIGPWTAPESGAAAIRAEIATLSMGESRVFSYTGSLVDAGADELACNSVSVTANLFPEPFEAPPVCATTEEADFRVETANRLPLQEGRTGTVPFVVTNGGRSQLASAIVTLTLPDGLTVADLTVAGWDCTAQPIAEAVEVTCVPVNPDGTTRSLAVGASETIGLQVIPDDMDQSLVCVDAVVDGLIFDPNPDNDETSSCATIVSGSSLVAVAKTDGVTVASSGDSLTYTLTATNRLVAETLSGPTITDTLPGNVRYVGSSDGGVHTGADADGLGGTVTWTLPDLAAAGTPNSSGSNGTGAPGSTVTRTVTVVVDTEAVGQIVNEAELTAPDPADPGLQLAAQSTDVDGLQRLTVAKASDAAAAGVRTGDVVTYSVTLTNSGTVDYTGANPARLVDDLSDVLDNATFVAGSAEASVDGGAPVPLGDPDGNDRLSWSGALAAGSAVTVTYQATVGEGATGDVLANVAYASSAPSSCTDGLTPAAESCATLTTQFAPMLAKVVTSSQQNDDGTWTTVYSVVVTNVSPTDPATYTLNDALAYGAGITVESADVTASPLGVTVGAWTGSGPVAAGVTIPANSQHTYELTVTADAASVGGTSAAVCAPGVAGGFANRASLTTTDGRSATAEACAAPVEPSVEKSVVAPVQQTDGTWSIVYTVTVSNPHPEPASLAYTLRDELTIPAGISVISVDVAGPAGAPINGAFDGSGVTALLSGADRVAAGSSRVFTISVVVNSPSGAEAPADLACPPAGSGGYANLVTLLAGTTELDTASACADATPQPMPEIAKRVLSSAVNGDGNWIVTYDIAVSNLDSQYSTRYTLRDELDFATGSSVVDAEVTSASASASATWNGSSDVTVATDVALPPDTTHRYTVVVEVDPETLSAESPLADCRLDDEEDGTGFRNVATVTSGARSAFAAACEPFTDPSVVKTVSGAPTQNPTTGMWRVQYELTVTNRSILTSGTIDYTLTDELGFAPELGATVVDVEAPDGATLTPGFDGVDVTELGTHQIGAAVDESTPTVQVWTITVEFAVPAGLTDGTACDPAQEPGGLRNESGIAVGNRFAGASVACVDVPDVPMPGIVKSVLSQEQQTDGSWLMLYRVTVANPSATAASRYTLEDQLALGTGLSLVGDASVVFRPDGVAVESDFNGHSATTISENILLPAAGSHTYTVRAVIDSGALTGDDPAADCVLQPGETSTGFGNVARIDSGVADADSTACARAWDPGVTKELDGVPTQQPDGSWLLSYTMTVTNPSDVPLAYGLVDELDFPDGTAVTVESAASRTDPPAVNTAWNGSTVTQLVNDGTALPANAIHVFDVTVRALLPEDQASVDDGWANAATVRSGVGGVVTTEADAVADIQIPELAISKSATPSAGFLHLGDTVDYEIVIENVGEGDFTALYPAVVWDDLRDVEDDAEITSGPSDAPQVGNFALTGEPEYRYSAPLAAGDTVTISYTVTITGGGDANLVNVAYVAGPDDDQPPSPATADCTATWCAFTQTPLAALDVTKSVDQTTVAPGSSIEYTVTVTNTGNADIPAADPAVVTDDLSNVLDDADYTGDATSDIGTVDVVGSTLTWTGGLAIGQTATITYSVTVHPDAATGARLVNAVVSDPTLATLALGGGAADGTATTTTTVQRMANTGVDGGMTGIRIALFLVVLGLGLLFVRQRRSQAMPTG